MTAAATLAACLFSASALAQETQADPAETAPLSDVPPPLVEAAPGPAPAATPAPAPRRGRSRVDEEAPAEARRLSRLSAGPLSVFVLAVTFEYERALNEKMSWFVGPRIGMPVNLGLSAGLRFFPMEGSVAPTRGLWVGPELYSWFESNGGVSGGQSYASTGFGSLLLGMLGYTHTWSNGFSLSVGGGLGGGYGVRSGTSLGISPTTGESSIVTANSAGFVPSIASHFNLGWAF